jgi:acyl-CoA synthetase
MRLHRDSEIARYRAMGAWTDDLIDQCFRATAAVDPDRVAIVDPPNRPDLTDGDPLELTWASFDNLVWRLAAVLFDEGVRAGDVVALQLPNTVEIAATFLAAVRLGAIVCPFPVQYRTHEIGSLATVAGATHIVTMARIGHRSAAAETLKVASGSSTLKKVLTFGDEPPGCAIGLDDRIASVALPEVVDYVDSLAPDPNDCVTICWTSGTESTPKGVPRAHCDWLAICTSTVEGPGLTADDVLLNPFPMVNMAGISGMFLPWVQVGGVLVQHHPFDLATFLRQISERRSTYTVAPPALLTQLLHREDLLAATDISSLRLIGSGSAPLAPALLEGWHHRYGIDIINFYGSNEGIALLGLPQDIPDPSERAQFFPRYGFPGKKWSFRLANWTQTRIVDVDTEEEITEPGIPGELRIKGPSVFAGYLPASQVADPFDADGFLRTGDMLEIAGDEGQYLCYVDRMKDIVIRGGVKISAAEIENLIAGHPAISEVAIVAYPDEILGERACAVVVPRPGHQISLEDIVAHLRALDVATYKLPERLLVVEELPRNPLGKVLKRELREKLRD